MSILCRHHGFVLTLPPIILLCCAQASTVFGLCVSGLNHHPMPQQAHLHSIILLDQWLLLSSLLPFQPKTAARPKLDDILQSWVARAIRWIHKVQRWASKSASVARASVSRPYILRLYLGPSCTSCCIRARNLLLWSIKSRTSSCSLQGSALHWTHLNFRFLRCRYRHLERENDPCCSLWWGLATTPLSFKAL